MTNKYFDQVVVSESAKRFVDKSFQIGDEIIRLLEKKGMTQRQLAEALGKKESQVSKWLTGLHNFTLKTITEIESVFGEELLLTKSHAKQRYAKAAVVLHNTVVDPKVFSQLREAEHVALSAGQKLPNHTNAPLLMAGEFSFS